MLQVRSALEALEAAKDPTRWWYGAPDDVVSGDGDRRLACDRVRTGYFSPTFHASITADSDAAFFCIGSCFARRIERTLLDLGRAVVSLPADFALLGKVFKARALDHYLNFYNLFALQTALEIALGQRSEPAGATVSTRSGEVVDLLGQPNWTHPSEPNARSWRDKRYDALRRVVESDIVIITLGAAELWRDRETGLLLNERPYVPLIQEQPDRFEFCVSEYEENRDALTRVIQLIRGVNDREATVVVTVSPVSLQASFGDRDVTIASMYTKSVLRSVAEAVVARDPAAVYFPTYEMAWLSDPAKAWDTDQAHAAPEMVRFATERFIQAIGEGRRTAASVGGGD